MTIQFKVGNSYSTRSVCNHDAVFSITVKSRTAKTIKTECGKTLRISEYEGAEFVKPCGSYSMAPIIKAQPQVVAPVTGERVKAMLAGAEFNSLFSAQEQAEILDICRSTFSSESKPQRTAKIFNLAAYRSPVGN